MILASPSHKITPEEGTVSRVDILSPIEAVQSVSVEASSLKWLENNISFQGLILDILECGKQFSRDMNDEHVSVWDMNHGIQDMWMCVWKV